MDGTHQIDGGQAALWNGAGGDGWVELQAVVDRLYEPLEDLLVEAAATGPGRRVLDVGCGTGATTVALARRLGPGADCTGIDISEPMVAAARARAEAESVPARFVQADAQRHRFEPASFDVIASRFGIMFFDDFARAFANLRAAATDGAFLRAITWRRAEENPFMTTAERAAAPLVSLPARRVDEPGQFALADPGRIRSLLEDSGWHDVDVQPIDVDCTMPEQVLVQYLTRLGPVGRALAGAEPATRARVGAAVRPAFDPYIDGPEVRFTAACWMVRADA